MFLVKSKKNQWTCKVCKWEFEVTVERIKTKRTPHGYKGNETVTQQVVCPVCHAHECVEISQLPLRVVLALMKRKE